MARLELSYEKYEKLIQAAAKLQGDMEAAINEALKSSQVKNWMVNSITEFTPMSKAKIASWHPRHARGAKPYKETYENLSIIIKSKTAFNYLYFPDDGSNTKRHQGMQQFMLHGAEAVSDQVADEIVDKIVEKTGWN